MHTPHTKKHMYMHAYRHTQTDTYTHTHAHTLFAYRQTRTHTHTHSLHTDKQTHTRTHLWTHIYAYSGRTGLLNLYLRLYHFWTTCKHPSVLKIVTSQSCFEVRLHHNGLHTDIAGSIGAIFKNSVYQVYNDRQAVSFKHSILITI